MAGIEEATCARENHHVGISQQINRIDEVTDQLKRLLCRINGSPTEAPSVVGLGENKAQQPSLSDVLEGSSQRICEKVNHALDLINDVEHRIF